MQVNAVNSHFGCGAFQEILLEMRGSLELKTVKRTMHPSTYWKSIFFKAEALRQVPKIEGDCPTLSAREGALRNKVVG